MSDHFLLFSDFYFLEGDYNDEEDEGIPEEIPDDDEDNLNKIMPIPKSSAFFIFGHENR